MTRWVSIEVTNDAHKKSGIQLGGSRPEECPLSWVPRLTIEIGVNQLDGHNLIGCLPQCFYHQKRAELSQADRVTMGAQP